ncbi:hypothetical protein BH11PSE10_BH11PSE10_01290 [soil metagenome]
MDGQDDRLQQMAAQLARLEALLDKPPPPAKSALSRWIGWMGAELPKMIAAIVVLVLGFAIKDSVDLSIRQRQLDLSYSKEMQGLLQQLSGGGTPQQLQTTAVVLASFGAPALPALLSELRQPGLRGDAAAEGLNVLALREPEVVCAALPRLLGLRRQYDWQAHERVVLMLGQHGCRPARKGLQAYRALVQAAVAGQPARFEALLREPTLNPQEVYPRVLKSVDDALSQLE